MPLDAGTRVGRYRIDRLLAQGGMAEVYRAEQDLTGGITRPVALKVIRPEYSESDDFRQMFLDEARTACTLSHPNIVHIYEVGETDDGQLFMVMELVTGETLSTINRSLREHDERFSDEGLFAIGVACCSALEAVHALKVEGGTVNLVHRDVSPHNILLSSAGALKLIDFGIAKAATNRNLTMPGVTKGKAGYFSPEQAMGKRLDGRSDLFSLGVTLYKLASGGTPFDDHPNHAERHAALVRGQWKHLEEVYPGLPEGFYGVVRKALGLKPDERYQTAREMREALERAAFDARIRLGQSSLLGYVDDHGEVTESGGSRATAAPSVVASPAATVDAGADEPDEVDPDDVDEVDEQDSGDATVDGRRAAALPVPTPSVPRVVVDASLTRKPSVTAQPRAVVPPRPAVAPQKTDRLSPGQRPRPTRHPLKNPLVLLAFVASIVIGVFGTVLLAGRSEGDKPTGKPVPPPVERPVVVTEPVVKVAPPEVKPEPVVEVKPEPVEPKPDVKPVEVKPSEPVKPKVAVVTRPKAPEVPVKPEKPVEKDKPAPEPVEAAIPPGEGKLRVDVRGGAAKVSVGNDAFEDVPLNVRHSSGQVKVTVKLGDGSIVGTRVPVLPDQTTIVTFDAATQRWSTRTQ